MPTDPGGWKLVTDYGVAIVGLYFITRFLAWMVKYILERNKSKEDALLLLLTNDLKHLSESMNTLTLNMTNFVAQVDSAHRFQKEEHKEQNQNSIEICKTLISTNDCLSQIKQFIQKLNGYDGR